jgi:hypothetical protein
LTEIWEKRLFFDGSARWLGCEEAGNELVIEDANAAIELTNLSPISTAADQTISVARVKVGETELTDGSVTFRIENNAAVIGETRWRWLGGAIARMMFTSLPASRCG